MALHELAIAVAGAVPPPLLTDASHGSEETYAKIICTLNKRVWPLEEAQTLRIGTSLHIPEPKRKQQPAEGACEPRERTRLRQLLRMRTVAVVALAAAIGGLSATASTHRWGKAISTVALTSSATTIDAGTSSPDPVSEGN